MEILVERLRQLSAAFRFQVFGDFEGLFVPGVSVKYFTILTVFKGLETSKTRNRKAADNYSKRSIGESQLEVSNRDF